MARKTTLAFALILLCACPDRGGQVVSADAAVADAPPDAAAGEPAPVDLEFKLVVSHSDGGTLELPLSEDEKLQLEPTQTLQLTSNLPLSNYRIRVFDEVDRAMVSDDVGEDTPSGLDYRIQFENPLKRGHRYTIVIDGQSGPLFTDSTGRTHPERRYQLTVAGEREKPKPPPRRRRR